MAKSSSTAVDHIAKQKKKKNLGDNMVYSSRKGVVEMHPLGKVRLNKFDNKELQEIIDGLINENKTLNKRLDKAKNVIKRLDNRIKRIEKELKAYGMVN